MKKGAILFLILILLSASLIIAQDDNEEYNEDHNEESKVSSIVLKAEEDGIEWDTVGYSKGGFKVIWSKNENPEYPTRDNDKYHYFSDADKEEDSLEPFDGAGTYYARVCEYLGGKCGVYSNQIKIILEEEDKSYLLDKEYKEEYEKDPREVPKTDKTTPAKETICNGCEVDGVCFPLGHRISGQYCSNELILVNQTEEEISCENNFECESNVCVSGTCVDNSLIQKVLTWLKKFFN